MNPQDVYVDSKVLKIVWKDGHKTSFDVSWLKENAYDGPVGEKLQASRYGNISGESDMTLWDQDVIAANPPKEFSYRDITSNDHAALRESLDEVFRYGFVFVNDTPTDEVSTLKICQTIVGPIRETAEGRVYVVENKVLNNSDLSQFSNALQGHTDSSFYSDPLGLQAMHCFHHYGTGGMNFLVDGFKAAKTLYQEDPDAYHVLSRFPLRFVSSYFNLECQRTILELDPFTKALTGVRWNTSRIAPLTKLNLSFEEMGKLYRAMHLYGSILHRKKNELWFKLTPGKVVLVDNRRILHGRSVVQGQRKLVGYYLTRDDYFAKWKENRMKQGIIKKQ